MDESEAELYKQVNGQHATVHCPVYRQERGTDRLLTQNIAKVLSIKINCLQKCNKGYDKLQLLIFLHNTIHILTIKMQSSTKHKKHIKHKTTKQKIQIIKTDESCQILRFLCSLSNPGPVVTGLKSVHVSEPFSFTITQQNKQTNKQTKNTFLILWYTSSYLPLIKFPNTL